MPLGPAEQGLADELIALYREAQDRLQAELARALQSPERVRQVGRLRAMIATSRSIRSELEAGTRDWLTSRLPEIHAAGAQAAADTVGSSFAWTQPHIDAVQALASTTWSDVASNLQGLDRSTQTAIRSLTRDSARDVLLEGRTAAQAGRDLESWMGAQGIGAVTYSNGARHLAGDYADTLARTVTANAYNAGSFTQTRGDGIEWMEATDGPGCGLSSHNDPEKVNGRVFHIDVAEENPLAHPRCARSWAPRPDIGDAKGAEAARVFTPDEQAQMAAEEDQRAATATQTLSGRARTPRVARAARRARQARSAR